MFLHQRGANNSLYFTFLLGALMVGPALAGVMATKSSWRNFWWLNVALQAAALVVIIFFLPETKWHRANPNNIQNQQQQTTVKFQLPHDEKPISYDHVESIEQDSADVAVAAQATSEQDSYLNTGRPSKGQFKLFQPSDHFLKTIAQGFMTPWKLFAFLIVEFSAFVVSWSSSSFLNGNLIKANVRIFAPPSEYLASLQLEFTRNSIYDQFREQMWTDMDCYEFFTAIEKFMGFESTWLRHKGWKEEKIQESVPGIKKKDPYCYHLQMAIAAQPSIPAVLYKY
ncbi:hypothetical protein N7488_001837 [Penicillium malachiteum]|nr:hypothetical protein N7488_001837 [Penicillium malachiteum]